MQINGPSRIDEMDGHEFEYFCAEILRRNGFSNVEVTRGSGDYGIDILCNKNEESYAIQCKRFGGKVGNKAVQEALSGRIYYDCDIAVVLTNSFFTDQAIETARRTNVLLWNRNKLFEMVKAAYPTNASLSNTSQNEDEADEDEVDEDIWLGLEDKSFFTAPTISQQKNSKTVRQSNRPRLRIGCLGVVLIFVAIICLVAFFGEQAETKKREEKKDIMVSAINKDEDPTATIDIATEDSENNSLSVIENGICYIKNGDHFEVVGLSDYQRTSITIQESIEGLPVTTIREKAFMDENIVSVSLPSSVTDIQSRAFCSCRKLTSINIPNGITHISEDTFLLCESLQSINLPDSVTDIDYGAFSSTGLRSINLGNVTRIGTYAFSGSRLTTVTLSPDLVEIGEGAFKGCGFLTSITIPEGVEKIGRECFMDCDSMRVFTLPETVTTIGNRCFYGCDALTEIRIPPNVKSLQDRQMFGFCYALEVIYIPADCKIPSGNEPFSYCSGARIVYY